MKNLLKALFNAKSEIGKIAKDSTNPFYKSKYFDVNSLLEHVEPILHKHGLVCLQPIVNGKVTTIIAHVESGEQISSEISLIGLADPQKAGSEITYYRRYTLQSLLALQAEDDDANKTVGHKQESAANAPADDKKWLNKFTDKSAKTLSADWSNVTIALRDGKATIADVKKKFKLSKEIETELNTLIS
jgi:hypothetical protein